MDKGRINEDVGKLDKVTLNNVVTISVETTLQSQAVEIIVIIKKSD